MFCLNTNVTRLKRKKKHWLNQDITKTTTYKPKTQYINVLILVLTSHFNDEVTSHEQNKKGVDQLKNVKL